MERGDLVKMISESIEKNNALPKEEKRLMSVQNDIDVSAYMFDLLRRGAYTLYRRVEGNLIPGP